VKAEYEAEVSAAAALKPAPPAGGGVALVALADTDSLAKGKAIFESQTNPCQSCHRPDLGGLVGPNLTDEFWLHGCSMGDLATTIKTGYPTRGMLPYGGGPALSDLQVQQVASYILSKHDSHPPNPKPVDAERDVKCEQGSH
jgi:cytochrome c oxidase cbb3-type subunit III